MRRLSFAAALLLALCLPLPLAAQAKGKKPAAKANAHRPAVPEQPAAFALPEGPRVTLADAIATTLERSPDLESARQNWRILTGAAQEASGRFDPVLTFSPSIERQKTFLTETALQGEVSKRQFLHDSSDNLTRIANDIAGGLTDSKGNPFPDCKGSQYYINGFPVCTDKISSTSYQTFQLLQDAQDATAGQTSTDKLQQAINKSVNARLANIVSLIRRVFLPSITSQIVNIGELPRESETDTFTADLRLMKPFRNGMQIGPGVYWQGTRYAFSDKPDSPAYGGTGVPTLYRAVVGLAADVPLFRGGGEGSAGAEERSAKLQAEAGLESVAQAAADAALNTTIAYWNLSAAQEMQKLLTKGVGAQHRIGELSRALVQGDEIPRAELSRVDAQTADIEASALQAARGVAAARVELARAMGLDIVRIEEAPIAADPLPGLADVAIPDAKGMEELTQRLVDLRGDLRAAKKRVDAAKVLEHAARLDLKPRLDLSFQGGWNAIYEDPSFAITRAWNPTGYYRAFGDRYVGPSVQVNLAFQLPFGNDAQRGRLVSAEALRAQSEMSARNLERLVTNEARELATALPVTARETAAREAAAGENDKTVGYAYERFRASETTVLDAILSERSRIQSQADLVAARQTLALKAARLQWIAGTLVPVARSDGELKFGVARGR